MHTLKKILDNQFSVIFQVCSIIIFLFQAYWLFFPKEGTFDLYILLLATPGTLLRGIGVWCWIAGFEEFSEEGS